jgi:hypothetical protein
MVPTCTIELIHFSCAFGSAFGKVTPWSWSLDPGANPSTSELTATAPDTYVAIFVSTYIHLCIYIFIYLCIYIFIYLCIYKYIHVLIYICIHICTYVSIYTNTYTSICNTVPRAFPRSSMASFYFFLDFYDFYDFYFFLDFYAKFASRDKAASIIFASNRKL